MAAASVVGVVSLCYRREQADEGGIGEEQGAGTPTHRQVAGESANRGPSSPGHPGISLAYSIYTVTAATQRELASGDREAVDSAATL